MMFAPVHPCSGYDREPFSGEVVVKKLTFLLLIAFVLPLLAQEEKKSLEIPKGVIRRGSESTPKKEPIPRELVLQGGVDNNNAAKEGSNRGGKGDKDDKGHDRGRNNEKPDNSRKPRDPAGYPTGADNLEKRAREEAELIAADLASGFGFREYYQVGFFKAMKQAVESPGNGERSYRDGLNHGRSDEQARHDGEAAARQAARDMAAQRAAADVAAQFQDLKIRPRNTPDRGMTDLPPFSFKPEAYQQPDLELIFAKNPLDGFNGWKGRSHHFYENWRPDPRKIYGSSRWEDLYDNRWQNPDFALENWRGNRNNRKYYDGLSEPERNRFKSLFQENFNQAMPYYFQNSAMPGYDLGWSDGWGYGAYVAAELSFQQGYFQGAMDLAVNHARETFLRQYPQDYRQQYLENFNHWQNNPFPELRDLLIEDGNGDGILEPGESFTINMTALNFGGASVRLPLLLSGDMLAQSEPQQIHLAARSQQPVSYKGARIDRHTGNGATLHLELRLGDHHQSLDALVSWPLQLEQPRVLERDNLAGKIRLAVSVRNTSTKQVREATVVLGNKSQKIRAIEPGGEQRLDFDQSQLDPLSLLGGQIQLAFTVERNNQARASLNFQPSEQVTDPQNNDLNNLLIEMATGSRWARDRINQAHDLVILRMEADWQRAIAVRGNPYKEDLRRNGRETALGQLVQAWRSLPSNATNKAVFTGLKRRLESLAEELPGSHPFLRKQFKRLAGQLR